MKPKAKTKQGQAKRQASKRAKASAATTDLLKIADKVAFQSYAAAGIGQTKTRALRALQRMYSEDKPSEGGTKGQTIIICRELAASGMMSHDAFFALLASLSEDTAWEDARIQQLSKAIEAWYDEHGATDNIPTGEGPADLEALRDEFDERFRQIQVAVLRHYEADDMVDLLLHDPEKYAARYDQGVKDLQAERESKGNTGS